MKVIDIDHPSEEEYERLRAIRDKHGVRWGGMLMQGAKQLVGADLRRALTLADSELDIDEFEAAFWMPDRERCTDPPPGEAGAQAPPADACEHADEQQDGGSTPGEYSTPTDTDDTTAISDESPTDSSREPTAPTDDDPALPSDHHSRLREPTPTPTDTDTHTDTTHDHPDTHQD